MTETPTRRQILGLAWPIVLANCATPLLGLVDTAVIGRGGTTAELGAIALGALVMSFVAWSFGFLRMGTTGFVSQAKGAGDEDEVRASLGRALLIAGSVGVLLLALQRPIVGLALWLLDGSAEVEGIARDYVLIRIWGTPATLASYAVLGTLIGLGHNRVLLVVQLFLNGLNIGLDVWFAGVLGWGAEGIALGTVIAEWCAALLGLFAIHRILVGRRIGSEPFWRWSDVTDLPRLRATLGANRDLMVRTIVLLLGFAWFTDRGAALGDVVLAANHVLLQFVSFSAFFLDGYALVAEALVGSAFGARSLRDFDAVVRRSTELGAVTAALLGAAVLFGGEAVIALLTDHAPVREVAGAHLPFAACYVLLSFATFQLDGIFIGATRAATMRNAALVSLAVFVGCSWVLDGYANAGLWLAFEVFLVARTVTLAVHLPGLRGALAVDGAGREPQ